MIDFARKIPNTKEAIGEAIRGMVNADHFFGGSIVTMPVLYPSGTTVALEVTRQGDKCLVSDRGGGWQEADMMGATRYFKKEANRVAEASGIRFDGHDMFVAEVAPAALQGAMMVVANCSQEATAFAAYRMAERSESDAKDILFARLSAIFGATDVAKDAELVGASNHTWKVSVLVTGRPHLGLFEPVMNKYISVVGTAAKFHDFSRLEHPPSRIAVVKSREDIGDFYGVVASASTRVVEQSASNEQFLRLVA
ncbi:hypothetical protein [Mesorhizobium temperatum]|uniref:DUF1828 domain-containing protein n=1 Tax=Mesorhizobium temperatum TaxID=241416 RepID=A0A271LRG7_9HYPH|nr:hypothetical protein [Mesorhizobium temperatum]PAQ09738.1 hypothetical protein CIT26_11915 [Mesorhizobium temperatum]